MAASVLMESLNHFGMFAGEPRQPQQPNQLSQTSPSTPSHRFPHKAAAAPSGFDPPRNKGDLNNKNNNANHIPHQYQTHHQTTMSRSTTRSSSPDGSASNGSGSAQQHHTTKTGRKGDPRMHRAVAARLADPNMTLFEALKAGGFQYPDDNNPSYVDSEKITLAQRKNQLSRRLRIARRSDGSVNKYPAPSPTDNQNKFESLVEKQKQSFQMMQQTMELERRTSSGAYSSTGLKRARGATQKAPEGESSKVAGKPKRKSLIDDDDDEEEANKKQPSQMMAKYHPQFQQLLVPQGLQFSQTGPFPAVPQPMNAFGMNHQATGMGMLYPNVGYQVPNMAPVPPAAAAATTTAASTNQTVMSASQSNVSGVALRSLTNTAQTVGLSLEQLALALSNTRNLAHVVLGEDDEKNPATAAEQKKKKQELALQMYQHEVRPVYARCMLLAGYKSDMTSESSKDYLKFAWKAWQKEGRRLRDLLEESDMLVADAPDFHMEAEEGNDKPSKKLKAGPPEDEDKAESISYSRSRSHSHQDCHTADGRHIHRLEKCGHKAILHQPKDGEAHIDFLVGDKVECYAGIASEQKGSSWPSQYPCETCDSHEYATSETSEVYQPLKENAPKVLDLKSIDLQGSEWNVDFVDDTLTGLVRLGESSETPGTRSDSSLQGT